MPHSTKFTLHLRARESRMKLLLDTWQDEQNKEMRFAYQVGRFWNDFVFELDHMINCNFLNNFQRLQNGYLFTRWLHKRPKPQRRTALSAQSSSSGSSLSATDVELVPSQHSNRLQIELTMYITIYLHELTVLPEEDDAFPLYRAFNPRCVEEAFGAISNFL